MNSDFTCLARFYIMYNVVGAVFVDVIVVAVFNCWAAQLCSLTFLCFLFWVIADPYHTIFAQLMIVDCIVNTRIHFLVRCCSSRTAKPGFIFYVRHTGSCDNNGVN